MLRVLFLRFVFCLTSAVCSGSCVGPHRTLHRKHRRGEPAAGEPNSTCDDANYSPPPIPRPLGSSCILVRILRFFASRGRQLEGTSMSAFTSSPIFLCNRVKAPRQARRRPAGVMGRPVLHFVLPLLCSGRFRSALTLF